MLKFIRRTLLCLIPVLIFSSLSSAHVIGSTNLEDGAPHWYTMPYDLKYDSKWTHFPESKVEMNGADEVVLSGFGDFSSAKPYGMRFAPSDEWESFISGHTVKVTLEVRSSTKDPMKFKVAYMTRDNGFSGWYMAIANPKTSTFSFTYKVPEMTKVSKDFLVVVPEDQGIDLIIRNGFLELVDE